MLDFFLLSTKRIQFSLKFLIFFIDKILNLRFQQEPIFGLNCISVKDLFDLVFNFIN